MRAVKLALALAFATPAAAVETYDDCIAMIETDPDRAQREAGDWSRYGTGGAAARHCYALALLAIGAPDRAVDELIGAATEETGLPDSARADLLVQAGELLIDTNDLLTAAVVAEQAVRLAPRGASALGLRGAVHAANGDLAAAIRDLDEALTRGGAEPRYLLRRAAAYRRQGNLIAARDDASYATELSPDSAEAWLERGRIEAGIGDKDNARQSLLAAIALDGTGRMGATARNVLQRMEAGVE